METFGITMDDQMIAAVGDIKSKVASMLKERAENDEFSDPSQVWSAACSYFDYLLDMSDKSFSKIRLHTYFLTSDYYLPYSLGTNKASLLRRWKSLIKNVPSDYIIYEPKGGFGFNFSGDHLVSSDSFRYQKTINSFYRHGLFSLLKDDKKKTILEIGGGYGGFAHHLSKLSSSTTYVILDLPETFLFSAPYLTLHNPEKKIYVYDKDDFDDFIQSDISAFDFVFIPNYKLDQLVNIRFDIVLNVNSMQEMTTPQVREYLDFVQKTCAGTLYSCNQDRLAQNQELSSLQAMLTERFELTEVYTEQRLRNTVKTGLNKVRRIASSIGGSSSPRQYHFYREFFCKPLAKS
jgi:SAM-dependent methyltransferase